MDWLKTAVITVLGGTGGQTDDEIHLGDKDHIVTGFTGRRINPQLAIGSKIDIHKDIKGGGDIIWLYTKTIQMGGEIFKTAGMGIMIVVHDLKGLRTARGQQEIVSAVTVFEYFHHLTAPVAPQVMALTDE